MGKTGISEPWRIGRRMFLQASAGFYFTAGPAESAVGFGIVTDVHYANREPAGTRFYRMATSKLRACVELMNAQKVDFLMELGDFKDQDVKPAEETTLQFLQTIEQVFAAFQGPRYHVLGNHDLDSISKDQFQRVVTNTGVNAALTWYSFDHGGCHFTILDANFRSDQTPYSKGNYDWRDSNIPISQITWLQSDLKSATAPVIIAVHQRLDEGGAELSIANRVAVRHVIEESGKVALVLQGHAHEGGCQRINGIHYYTLAAEIEGSEPADSTCAIVRIQPTGGIEITGYQRAVSHKLGYSG